MRFNYPEIPDSTQPAALQPATVITDEAEEAAIQHADHVVDDELVSYDEPTEEPLTQPSTPFSKVARVVSWIFVPLLMPVYAIAILFTLSILNSVPAINRWAVGGVVVGINVIFPMLMILLMKRLGIVHDVGLNRRHERVYPYIITILAMGSTAFYLAMRAAPQWAWILYVAAALTAAINMVVNTWWKISAHAAGAGGVVAIFVALQNGGYTTLDMTPWILGSAIVAGFMGSCRVYLYRHTPLQVIAGYSVGFLSVYILSLFA